METGGAEARGLVHSNVHPAKAETLRCGLTAVAFSIQKLHVKGRRVCNDRLSATKVCLFSSEATPTAAGGKQQVAQKNSYHQSYGAYHIKLIRCETRPPLSSRTLPHHR